MIENIKRLAVVALLVMAGCREKEAALVPVSGRITVNNEPLVNARVLFTPSDPGMASVNSSALTDEGGNFELKATDGRPGAVVGQHSVIISPPMIINSATVATAGNIGGRPGDEVDLPDSVRFAPTKTKGGASLAGPTEVGFEVPEGGDQTVLINVQSKR